ncbi:MAG: M23 family metallopeptidase [Balneolaceae bacterium]
MWDFLKKLFSEREGDVTVIVLDEQDPDGSNTFRLAASDVVKLGVVIVIISVVFTTVLFFATPIGSLYQQRQDQQLRTDIISITERVQALQDSLHARDVQLQDMQTILRTVPDTTFPTIRRTVFEPSSGELPIGVGMVDVQTHEMLSRNEIIFSERLERAPDFPAPIPVQGRISQEFSFDTGHLGLDIAARSGSVFTALADGVVVHAGWTINYGYVLHLQHADGLLSVYKHGSKLLKQQGDFVLKGDILGEVGDRGVLSRGSHLHLEIWRNGVPQNPRMYLIND